MRATKRQPIRPAPITFRPSQPRMHVEEGPLRDLVAATRGDAAASFALDRVFRDDPFAREWIARARASTL